MLEFSCPHCSTPLRLKDVSLRGRTIPCPDCHALVLLQEQGTEVVAVPAEPATSLVERSAPKTTPRMIARGIAALFFAALTISLLRGPSKQPSPRHTPGEKPDVIPIVQPQPPQEQKNVPDQPVRLPIEDALLAIAPLVQDATDGEPAPAGFSWIAKLAPSRLPLTPVQWDRNWDDPVNDEFVRRRFPEFENPTLERRTGEDGLPATHFAGVAGSRDKAGALLPGAFSDANRIDLTGARRDAANTMLIAGVTDQLGSWARPGRASIRSFNKEPYINGPDGFGTGQPDGMFVLMADGSVRFLNQTTDSAVIRKLASIQKPDPPPVTQPDAPLQPNLQEAIGAETPPEVPVIDIPGRLTRRLVAIEQTSPVPLKDLLFDLQELIGAPIDSSELRESTRNHKLTLSLQNPTLQEVFDEVSRQANIRFEIQAYGIDARDLPGAAVPPTTNDATTP